MSIQFDWIRQPSGATPEQFDEVERLFGVNLPIDYRDFATLTAGGLPASKTDYEFCQPNGDEFHGCVGAFLSLAPEGSYSILVKVALLGDWLPKNLLPVVEDPAGSFICLDFRTTGNPCISFWRHDRKGYDNEISYVAESFSSFLELLHDPDSDEEP